MSIAYAPLPTPVTGVAAPTAPPQVRHCQRCGGVAEIFDIDGCWDTPECRAQDRANEEHWWRQSAEVDPPVWMRTAVKS